MRSAIFGYVGVWASTLKLGFTYLKLIFLDKCPFLEKMLQDKWQNKAQLFISQYVKVGIF